MTTAFVRAANPIWFMVDLVGKPLDDTYFAFFLQNTFPYLPQSIFEDVAGTIPWANPLQFNANGTLPDNLYFNDSLAYRIEIRQGNSQSDPLIYEVNDFVPGNNSADVVAGSFPTENQVTNSQFSTVNFQGTLSITTANDYNIAPGWVLTCVGAGGTATVTQVVSVSNQDQVNNPPYTLKIVTSSFSEVYLTQRFNNNGAIWSSVTDQQDGIVSMSLTATSSTVNYTLGMYYVPSQTSQIYGPVFSGIVGPGDFQVLNGSLRLPVADNNQKSDIAYVDMRIVLQGTGTIEFSNAQCMGQAVPEGSAIPQTPVYQQETIERQNDHLFHYYKNSLLLQPKKSILTGWSFSLNPYQFVTTALSAPTPPAQTYYIADQTILHGDGDNLLLSGNATNLGYRYGLEIKANAAAASNSRVALIQYIDPSTALPYWSYKLSALVKAALISSNSTKVRFKVRLIYRTANGLPPTISATQPIAAWAPWTINNTDSPILAADWAYINAINDPTYTMDINSGSFEFPSYTFNGFQLPTMLLAESTLGIMVYTLDPLIRTGTADSIIFDKISLVPNDFAIDGTVETYDQVLKECEFYYEKSYSTSVLPGTADFNNMITCQQTAVYIAPNATFYSATFGFPYKNIKRADPAVEIYNPGTGLANNAQAIGANIGSVDVTNNPNIIISPSGNWIPTISTKAAYYRSSNGLLFGTYNSSGRAQPYNNQCELRFHYVADARLGR